jgi:hypothetical protein
LHEKNNSSHSLVTQDNSQTVISDSYHKSSTLNQKWPHNFDSNWEDKN